MEWFIFAVIAPILWAGCNVVDKIIFQNYKISVFSSLIMLQLLNIPFILIFLLFVKINFDVFAISGMFYGIISSASILFFSKAIKKEEVSRVISLYYTEPLFIAVFAAILLGEALTIIKYAGIGLLVISAIMVSYKKYQGRIILSSSLFLVLSSVTIWSLLYIFLKWVSNFTSVYSFLFWSFIGGILTASMFLLSDKLKKDFIRDAKGFDRFAWIARTMGNGIFWIATASFYTAISISKISVVGAIPSFQPFFVLLYVLLIGLFMPKLLKEENNSQTVMLKLLAVALIFIGSYLIVI